MEAEWGEATQTVKPARQGGGDRQQLRQTLHSANETLMPRLGTSNDIANVANALQRFRIIARE